VSKTQADQASPTEGDNAKRGDDSQPKAAEKESADPSPPRKHSEPEIIQMLSEALAQQASELTGEDIKWEKGRRHNVAKALARHSIDELEAGRLLFEYRKAYKVKRRWTVLAQKIGKVIDCSHRTIYRMVDKYEASVTRPREQDPKINRKEICGVRLSESEKRERNARLAVRAFLNNFPATKRGEKLADLLAEEAYQVWGIFEPFPIEIKIEPRRSRFTIDGRKKVQPPRVMEKTLASQVQEVAA
jgi:hypothetical protein